MKPRKPFQSLSKRSGYRCFYCGGPGQTRDHVPPKLFLEKPLPSDLTTVPCYRECNLKFQPDEEYFFYAIAYAAFNPRLAERLKATGDLAAAISKKMGLKSLIESQLSGAEDGIVYLSPDFDRIESVIRKMVLGLYFRRYKSRVSFNEIAEVSIFHQNVYPAKCHPLALTERFQFKKWDAIQPGVFEFIFVEDLSGKNDVRCLINIYDTIFAEAVCQRPTKTRIGNFDKQPRLFDALYDEGMK